MMAGEHHERRALRGQRVGRIPGREAVRDAEQRHEVRRSLHEHRGRARRPPVA